MLEDMEDHTNGMENIRCKKDVPGRFTAGKDYQAWICRGVNLSSQICARDDTGNDHTPLVKADSKEEGRKFMEEHFDLSEARNIRISLNVH